MLDIQHGRLKPEQSRTFLNPPLCGHFPTDPVNFSTDPGGLWHWFVLSVCLNVTRREGDVHEESTQYYNVKITDRAESPA